MLCSEMYSCCQTINRNVKLCLSRFRLDLSCSVAASYIRVHLDLTSTGPPRKGGHSYGHVTVRRSPDPPDGGPGFDQSHHERIPAVGPPLRGRISEPHGPL